MLWVYEINPLSVVFLLENLIYVDLVAVNSNWNIFSTPKNGIIASTTTINSARSFVNNFFLYIWVWWHYRAFVHQCDEGEGLKTPMVRLQQTARKVSSIMAEGNDVYCMASVAGNQGENQIVYPIYSPVLMSALRRSNWEGSIACSCSPKNFYSKRPGHQHSHKKSYS